MKKLLIGLFVFALLALSSQVHASALSDALLKIDNLTKEVNLLKSKLGASLYYSGTDGYTRTSYDYVGSRDTTTSTAPAYAAPITPTTDLTPRISYWQGKVNQHVSVSEGMWQTDPDGVSGAEIDKLTYCQKWYPKTTSVVEYKNETINAWHDRGNVNDYPSTRLSYKCIEPTVVLPPSPYIPATLKVSLDSTNPISQTIAAGSGNIVFARLKITAGSQDVNNLNSIQVASNLPNATKLNNINVYDGSTKIGSTSYGLSYNGDYYQSWVSLDNKLSIPANTSKVLSIVADTSPVGSVAYFNGDVRLGVAGWTFDAPGARVDPFGTAIYGNVFTIASVPVIEPVAEPTVKILTPNGGESYTAGQQVVLRWKTNNVAYNADTLVSIMDDRTPGWQTKSYFGSSPALNYAKLISSNGSEYVYEYTFTIPTTFNNNLPAQYQNIYGGNHYKMLVNVVVGGTAGTSSQKVLEDYSDGFFGISSAGSAECPTNGASFIKVVTPNGGENYEAGQKITVGWASCNLPKGAVITAQLNNANNTGRVGGVSPLAPQNLVSTQVDGTTANDGLETFTLPSADSGIYGYGKNFKLSLVVHSLLPNGFWGTGDNVIFDESDNTFTIKPAIAVISDCSNGLRYDSKTGMPCPTAWPVINTPDVKVYSPKSGDVFRQGLPNTISWTGGKNKVQVGLVSENYTGQNGILYGWVELNGKPNSITTWDGGTLKALDGSMVSQLIPGKYKVVIVSESEEGNYCSGSNSSSFGPKINCNFDLSNIITVKPAVINDKGCSDGALFNSNTGKACPIVTPTTVVDIGCSDGALYSNTTGRACPIDTNNLVPIKRTLRQGARGEDVKILQEFLGLNADGIYGRGTANRVREWQIENGLNGDGSFGFMSRQKAGLE